MTIAIHRIFSGDHARAAAAMTIDRACFRAPQLDAAAELERDFARLYVADLDTNSSVGYVLAWLVGDELEIHDVATVPAARRRGVGDALVRRALDDARADRATAAFLEVRASNGGAIALYARAGFTSLSVRKRYYADGEDALVLRLALTP